MWEINNLSQLSGLFYSVIMGVIFGILYDVLRAVRIITNFKNFTVFFQDILYFFIIANITFIYFLSVTNGEIRFYILIGTFIGFLAYFFTISKFVILLFKILFSRTLKLIIGISKLFYRFFDFCDLKITTFLKNVLKCFKKVLKKCKCMLYTNRK